MIIEINDTGNPYFERAVLYLKDSRSSSSKKSVETEAQNYMSNMKSSARSDKFCRSTMLNIVKLLLAALAGAMIMLLLLSL